MTLAPPTGRPVRNWSGVHKEISSQNRLSGVFPDTVGPRYGITRQEAPEAHAQEEASQDAQAHACAASARQVTAFSLRLPTAFRSHHLRLS